ncbi:hypothetical protein [Nocardia brasiliensis]|uniref:hypothetical protein n=1 Tax=Nocardia brasiliensis TaxID=37326 RepID=UPI0024553329|nr:hypothetical protein [Nocardia brasiliensis]
MTTTPGQPSLPQRPAAPEPTRILALCAVVVAIVIMAALLVLAIRLLTAPATIIATANPDPAAVLTTQQATSRSCASFSGALAAIGPLQTLLPAGWKPTDPGIDERIDTYTSQMDAAALRVRIEPGTAPTVRAALTDWVTTVLIGDQVIGAKDQKLLAGVLGPRLDAAELTTRAACGIR